MFFFVHRSPNEDCRDNWNSIINDFCDKDEVNMDFFKPQDFFTNELLSPDDTVIAADIANKKLKRNGRVVYACVPPGERELFWNSQQISKDTHSALLINIEEIPKLPCAHPAKLVRPIYIKEFGKCKEFSHYECSCGVVVEPISFKAVDKSEDKAEE